MSSTILFVIMVIIAAILLIVFSITASIAVGDISTSIYYNVDPRANSAYQYLIIAAALGWTTLVIMVVTLIVAIFTGGFTLIDVSPELLNVNVDYNQMTPTQQRKIL